MADLGTLLQALGAAPNISELTDRFAPDRHGGMPIDPALLDTIVQGERNRQFAAGNATRETRQRAQEAMAARQKAAVAAAQAAQPRTRPGAFEPRDPQAMGTELERLLRAMPGVQRVQAPQLTPPTAQEMTAAGNAMGGDARANAAAMMQGGLYNTPDFLAAPPGEAEMEDFAFRRMVALGDNAPRAVQNAWLGIQQAKQDRLARRADYHAQLIKMRHGADLNLRNQSFGEYSANQRLAAQNLMNLRLKQAELQMRADQQNAAAANQLGKDQRDAVLAFAQAGLKKGARPTVKDRATLEKEFVNPAANAWAAAQTGRQFFRASMEIANRLGLGVAGQGMQSIMSAVGGSAAREFQHAWGALRMNLVKTFSEEAGARAIDTPTELKALVATIPDVGADTDVIARWVTRWVKQSTKTLERKMNAVNDQFPGYGDIIMNDIVSGDEVQALTLDAMRNLVETNPQ